MNNYKEFGVALRAYRLAFNETLDEVSAAVEIDVDLLEQIEKGNILPEEDILALLTSHFKLSEKETARLYKLANYSYKKLIKNKIKKEVNILDNDAPIHYTDIVHVLANRQGVILQFMQSFNDDSDAKVVARVGMSLDHVKSMMDALDLAIEKTEE